MCLGSESVSQLYIKLFKHNCFWNIAKSCWSISSFGKNNMCLTVSITYHLTDFSQGLDHWDLSWWELIIIYTEDNFVHRFQWWHHSHTKLLILKTWLSSLQDSLNVVIYDDPQLISQLFCHLKTVYMTWMYRIVISRGDDICFWHWYIYKL